MSPGAGDRPTDAPPHAALRVPAPDDGTREVPWSERVALPDGTPVLMPNAAAWLAESAGEVDAELLALPYPTLCRLARVLPEIGAEVPLRTALREVLATHAPDGARLAVEAGCGVGPDLPALRAVADAVVAVDGGVANARVARALVRGEAVAGLARHEGRSFATGEDIVRAALDGVTVVVGNALELPLRDACADVALAANLVDSIRDPLRLIAELDRVLRPGGLLVLTSPFAWDDRITPPEAQLGGSTIPAFAAMGSEAALAAILRGETPWLSHLRYAILETRDVPWTLRDHARATSTYDVHLLVARKATATG
ncbi:MAG: methyltransferase domain-containing protein [Deltaproteobacteria bacterium]|nr:methyltransferase domain-containing protein [Deltaproteobacteria bacterium]